VSDTASPSDQGAASPPRRGLLAKLGRIVTVMQAIGAVLAVPFGLTSAYSVYSNNLSTEATCKGLRGSIVTAIDKNVDLDTRRRLIRRDVEAFEQSCAGFDPDAVEAFRRVLAKDSREEGGEVAADVAAPAPAPRAESAVPVPLPVPRPASLTPAQPRREGEHDTRHADVRHPEAKGGETRRGEAKGIEAKGGPAAGGEIKSPPTVAAPLPPPDRAVPEPSVAAVPAPVALPPAMPAPAMPALAMPAPPLAESPAHPPVARAKPQSSPQSSQQARPQSWPPAWTPVRPPADVIGVPAAPQPDDSLAEPEPAQPGTWRFGNLMR
jgi:hypothetical protein